jgi:hypothetical protein
MRRKKARFEKRKWRRHERAARIAERHWWPGLHYRWSMPYLYEPLNLPW